MRSAIARDSGPDRRTTPMPPFPAGVEIATIVSKTKLVDFGLSSHAAAVRPGTPPRTPVSIPIAAVSIPIPARRRWWRRRRHAGHSGRIDDHLAMPAEAGAFAAQLGFAAQREMNHTPLPAVHGIKEERRSGSLDLLGRGRCAQAQLLDPQHPVVVGIERN